MKRALISLAIAAVFLLTGAADAIAQDVAVVVNRSNPADTVSMAELRKILLTSESQWPVGKKAITVLMTRAERPGTLKTVCGMSENDFNVHLMHLTFNGETVEAPRVVGSGSELKQAVAASPGAIGFLRAADVDGSVKVLRINGLLPGQTGYPVSPK